MIIKLTIFLYNNTQKFCHKSLGTSHFLLQIFGLFRVLSGTSMLIWWVEALWWRFVSLCILLDFFNIMRGLFIVVMMRWIVDTLSSASFTHHIGIGLHDLSFLDHMTLALIFLAQCQLYQSSTLSTTRNQFHQSN